MNEFVQKLDMKVLGERLQKVRQHLKLRQTDVAEEIGCSSLTISRMERGETSTSLLHLLTFYSQYIDMNLLLGQNFDPDDDAVYNKNRSIQNLVKTRLELLLKDAKEQTEKSQMLLNESQNAIIEEMVLKLSKQVEASTKCMTENLAKKLEKTIRLL